MDVEPSAARIGPTKDSSSDFRACAYECVKARAVLGKWQAGVEEIKKAHRARDVAGLAQALARFQHSADDAEVSGARQDLERWRRLAQELPKMLKDAIEKRDVMKLREAMSDMSKDGPTNIDGAEEAKKMIKRYQIRARALDHAVGERKISSIQAALATWDFSRDDIHAVKARQAIALRDQQKQKLQEAVQRRDGPRLQQVVSDWEFDRTDEDFQQALDALTRYEKMVEDVGRMMGPPMDIVALANILDGWEWSKDDPVRLATQKRITEHENAARHALDAKDGWKLQRIWQFNEVKPKAKGSSVLQRQMGGIKWKATVAKNRYREATQALREALRSAVEESEFMRNEAFQEVQVPEGEDALSAPGGNLLMSLARFGTTGLPPKECELLALVDNWPFSLDDPIIQMAKRWLASRHLLKTSSVRYLDIALSGGHTQSIMKSLSRAAATAVPPRIYHKFIKLPENIVQAKEESLMREATMQAVGAMCLGVEPDELILASGFAKELADKAQLVRRSASFIEPGRIPALRAASKPPRIVHGILELVCHCVAGIHPTVRDPPRDTGWRTCQRMLNNQKILMEILVSLPDWMQSGRTEPIRRAKEHWQQVQLEIGRAQDCTPEAVRRQSTLAAQFLIFLEQVFGFYDLLSLSSVAPEQRRGPNEIVRDADAQRLADLQAACLGDVCLFLRLMTACCAARCRVWMQRARAVRQEVEAYANFILATRLWLPGFLAHDVIDVRVSWNAPEWIHAQIRLPTFFDNSFRCADEATMQQWIDQHPRLRGLPPLAALRRMNCLDTWRQMSLTPSCAPCDLGEEAVEECVERAKLQLVEATAVTTVSNAALGSVARGLKPPAREMYVAEPRRSSKFLTMGVHMHDRAVERAEAQNPRRENPFQSANKKIEVSRAFKHTNAPQREVDCLIIRITGEEAAVLHMPISSTVKDVQERLAALEGVSVDKQMLLVENREVSVNTLVKNLRKDRESLVFFTLLYRSDALLHRIEASMLRVAQCSQLDFELSSLLGGHLSDPAVCLIYGTSGFDGTVARPGGGERRQNNRRVAIDVRKNESVKALSDILEARGSLGLASPRKQSLQIVMLDLLRTLIEILRAHAWGTPRSGPCAVQVDTPWQFQVVCEILELSPSLLRKPLVPQANLCISLRLLAELEEAGLPASYQPEFGMRRISRQIQEMIGPPTPHTPGTAGTSGTDRMDRETSSSRQEKEPQLPREGDYQRGLAAISAFINAVKDYYQEFVPLRALAAANMSFLLQAEKAFKESGKVQRMSLGLENMCELPPDCNSVEGVVEAANLACEQLLALSEQGLPIVQPHVECAIIS
ncbi:unnamed protein product, partial [Effrenium voratum]